MFTVITIFQYVSGVATNNLRILHKDVHKLIHATKKETIGLLMTQLGITEDMVKTINQYRSKCELETVKFIPYP